MTAPQLMFSICLALFGVWFGFQIGAMWGVWSSGRERR